MVLFKKYPPRVLKNKFEKFRQPSSSSCCLSYAFVHNNLNIVTIKNTTC